MQQTDSAPSHILQQLCCMLKQAKLNSSLRKTTLMNMFSVKHAVIRATSYCPRLLCLQQPLPLPTVWLYVCLVLLCLFVCNSPRPGETKHCLKLSFSFVDSFLRSVSAKPLRRCRLSLTKF